VTYHGSTAARNGFLARLTASASAARRTDGLEMIAAVVLLAFNLRPAVNALGVVLPELQEATGLSGTLAGLLTALPTLCFAIMGFGVSGITAKLGARQVVTLSLVVLTGGQLLRATGSLWALFAGSVLTLGAITFGNVLLPGLIRRYFPNSIAPMTALYTTVLMVGQSLGSALALPVEHALGGDWRLGIGMWAATAAIALVPWMAVLVRTPGRRRRKGDDATAAAGGAVPDPAAEPAAEPEPEVPARAVPDMQMWRLLRIPHAWSMAVFFGIQSLQAYVVFGWVPAVLTAAGMSQDAAGALLAIATAMGIPISALVPTLLGTFRRHEVFVIAFIGTLAVGYVGLIVMPLTLPWLTAVLIGFGLGSFPMVLTLLAWRADTPEGTTALSGFSQSIGYLMASVGPVGFGLLHDLSGSYTASLIALIVALIPMLAAGLVAVRDWKIEDDVRARLSA
jgi:CP family cyanate transporter-like MFS transporter